ncbi:unnamed protein product [Brachionus calyciflorus]|uniref:CCHC-type domain-containing protein n=1 Tax=Brachionus calyciflorus TaxID=104777 RepID=A0A814M2T2_9BILA|nr:unnamed protein product [Brachionus calyciflorus]
MDQTDKISFFTDGLSGLTSGYVKFCKPKTLERAIEVAENYEAFKMSENPKNADIFFEGSKSGFKVKLRNKPYLYKHKKDQKYKSDHKQGSSKPKDKKKIVCYGCGSEGHYINQFYKINNRRRSIEKKTKIIKELNRNVGIKVIITKMNKNVEVLTKTNDLLKSAGFILDKEVEVVLFLEHHLQLKD